MKIAIIGTGAVGAALGEGWGRKGHEIIFGVRNTAKPEAVTLAEKIGASLAPVPEAGAAADVIALAVPWDAAQDALTALGDLGGKVLIDATNPLVFAEGALSLSQPDGISGGERVAAWARNARVVKTLNQVGAELMSAVKTMPAKPCLFLAGDDEEANEIAAGLVEDLGFEAFQAGGLIQSRSLEHFAMVWINQAVFRGLGRAWAFGVLRQS